MMANDCLRKFIYHPIIPASVDHDNLRESATHARALCGYQNDGEAIPSAIEHPARDFIAPLCAGRKELLEPVRVLCMARLIAQQNHARFKVAGLPGVQETVRSVEGGDVVRIVRN